MDEKQTILTPPAFTDPKLKSNRAVHEGVKTFAFDKSYWSFAGNDDHFAGQDDVFADLGRPLLENAFQGYNNCIFAYGQTGSGKSYSMMGYGADEGVIPKVCRDMFQKIDDIQQDPHLACTVEVSYLEIYNERVRDLLNPSTKGNLRVREHPSTGPYVEDLAKLVVRSFPEIENLMDEGNKARTVAATNMNETSSRSHAVFTLTLTQRRHDVETKMDTEKVAKISLVDLAGSERATSTGATGARLKEGAEINRSLSTLGRVIAALADLSTGKRKNASMVPYRDSVLTWLLKDSLGGNSLTAMIAAISPADINFEETLSTLRYADSAKRIKNHAVVNEDPNARMIRELKEELAQLRSKLSGGFVEGAAAGQHYPADTPLDKQFVSIVQADGSTKQVSKAEIVEQLSQSEKLYTDLNQTWEQKLQKTEQVHKEREAALEELGISIEKGFIGLSTPKRMPHLVNLSDDPLLAECLVYNLKPGSTTVGNVDTARSADIRLNGSKILHDHCTFENMDGVVTVIPKEDAAVMVNGIRVEQPKRLRSGYRIILGDFHIFRFNHPQEARAERAEEGSRLKHSIAADDICSPSLRPGHHRTTSHISSTDSDIDGDRSRFDVLPAPFRHGRESDWSLARREALSNVLGADQKMSNLTDDELDVLFEDLQRVRAVRRGLFESRLFDDPVDDDTASVTSLPMREKYLSGGTLDNSSLDTALTAPSTPQPDEEDVRLPQVREDMQEQMENQEEDHESTVHKAERPQVDIAHIQAEKMQMEQSLQMLKEEMVKQLQVQKEEHSRQMAELGRATSHQQARHPSGLTERQITLVKDAYAIWADRRHISMAASILQNASTLKEAQVMSQQMDKNVVFQFTILDQGNSFGSTYDLVLNDFSTDDDPFLVSAHKPCVAVRVIDFRNKVAHLWSIHKLHTRVKSMRQMYQYLDRPEYIKHFRLDNPFSEACLPHYTRIGDADIPLAAIFQCKVQDFVIDVYSPFTFTVIGIVRLSLEPSSAEAPPSTLKFNVVMHDFVGFPEREGTHVHAQLFFPGISEEDGATTTQMVAGFDEGPVKFDSVHSMSVSTSRSPQSSLRISMFAEVSSVHLDKLLSWDDMRDIADRPTEKERKARVGEHEYYNEEHHDVFARVQVQEIGEDGTYEPAECIQSNAIDSGAFQLHQGLQRRVVIEMSSTSGASLPWHDVVGARIGKIHLLDPAGKVTDMTHEEADVPLSLVAPPIIRTHRDCSTNMKLVANWDSGAHGSLLLDRPTTEGFRVSFALKWEMTSVKLARALELALDLSAQIRSRSYIRQTSMLSQIWSTERVVHSATGVFALSIRPVPSLKASDLWRLDTREIYVKGEESLHGWAPRSVSLVQDFLETHKRRRRATAVDLTQRALKTDRSAIGPPRAEAIDAELNDRQRACLQRAISLWQSCKPDISTVILAQGTSSKSPTHTRSSLIDINERQTPRTFLATAQIMPKNPDVLKSGHLLTPDASGGRWEKRYLELRHPYLHIHAVPTGDEIIAVRLTHSRVDSSPEVGRLLQRGNKIMAVFAVYASTKAWLFAARNEAEKGEWIWALDRAFYGNGEGSESRSSEDREDRADWS